MADCEAPSFSLGLDLDHTVYESAPCSPLSPPRASARVEDDEGFGPDVADSDPDMAPDPPPRILKRLRRGPGDGSSSSSFQRQEGLQSSCGGDDDIEEFSDEGDLNVQSRPSKWNQPLCSSSKVSLKGFGVLTTHSSGNCKKRKIKEASGVVGSATLEMGQSGLMFPKLTTSPLRRFQLLDSDSDSDDPVSEDVSGAHKIDPCFKEPSCKPNEFVTSFDQSRNASFKRHQNQDQWKDFSPVKRFSIPTPALNELCEEYFRSAKDKVETSVSASHRESLFDSTGCQRDEQIWNSAYPPPPAHKYFFHKDPRIRQLVRSRLCNFYPLGVDKVNHQPNASDIDYMGQFGNGETSKKKEVRNGYIEKSSTRGRTKPKEVTVEEPLHASGGWVAPKINSSVGGGESSKRKATKKSNTKTMSKGKRKANTPNSSEILHTSVDWVEPKDAGRRRVQAKGKSVGHWFTASDGRKVYVTKDGQELTGQTAYRRYRRENGSGFKKSKKKTSAKKKKTN